MMTRSELAMMISSAPKLGDWVVVFNGKDSGLLFWRPKSAGYTCSLLRAGVYSEQEAKEIEKSSDRGDFACQVSVSEEFQRLLGRMGYHGIAELAAVQALDIARKKVEDLHKELCRLAGGAEGVRARIQVCAICGTSHLGVCPWCINARLEKIRRASVAKLWKRGEIEVIEEGDVPDGSFLVIPVEAFGPPFDPAKKGARP